MVFYEEKLKAIAPDSEASINDMVMKIFAKNKDESSYFKSNYVDQSLTISAITSNSETSMFTHSNNTSFY